MYILCYTFIYLRETDNFKDLTEYAVCPGDFAMDKTGNDIQTSKAS